MKPQFTQEPKCFVTCMCIVWRCTIAQFYVGQMYGISFPKGACELQTQWNYALCLWYPKWAHADIGNCDTYFNGIQRSYSPTFQLFNDVLSAECPQRFCAWCRHFLSQQQDGVALVWLGIQIRFDTFKFLRATQPCFCCSCRRQSHTID